MCRFVSMLEILELLASFASAVVRLFAGPFDRRRISRFFENRGERVREIEWAPFSTGWLSNWDDRFYRVEYRSSDGDSQTTICRTSWRTGVVVTDEDCLEDAVRIRD